MCLFITGNSYDFLKEYLLIDITEMQFAFSEVKNEFLYYLKKRRNPWT